jgi:hypothetical protein
MELKCLTSLSLDLCCIGKAKDRDIRKLSSLRLKYLRFFGDGGHISVDDDALFISQFFCLDSLLTVHTNCWSFVTRIAEQNCDLPLRELDIVQAYDMALLPKVFQKTPALKKLRISPSGISQYDDIQFGDLLPVLDELCCPLYLLRSLVPGRPITSIQITTYPLTETLAIPPLFKKSTSKIRSLSVPIDFYQMIPFWEHFPDLESLRLEFVGCRHQNIPSPKTKQSIKKVFAIYFRIKSNMNSMYIYSASQLSVTLGLKTPQYKNCM